MNEQFKHISEGKSIYLASDFHLGAPTLVESHQREKKIIRWLETIEHTAAGIILVGDLFDFWFEYKHAVPKGYLRFLGKLAQLRDQQIPIIFFTGNHDLWMNDYFEQELGIQVLTQPQDFLIGNQKVYIAHGDGLGPGDKKFKFFKKIFINPMAKWAFRWLHPDIGIAIAKKWSGSSREDCNELAFQEENEWLVIHSHEIEHEVHHDIYVYGHRHLASTYQMSEQSTYFNLGEWVNGSSFLSISSEQSKLEQFEG